MTTRKTDIALSPRLTAYVTREEGAAELRVSPSTWDEMVECGQLPKRNSPGSHGDNSSAGAGPTLTVDLRNDDAELLGAVFQGVRQWHGQGPQT